MTSINLWNAITSAISSFPPPSKVCGRNAKCPSPTPSKFPMSPYLTDSWKERVTYHAPDFATDGISRHFARNHATRCRVNVGEINLNGRMVCSCDYTRRRWAIIKQTCIYTYIRQLETSHNWNAARYGWQIMNDLSEESLYTHTHFDHISVDSTTLKILEMSRAETTKRTLLEVVHQKT